MKFKNVYKILPVFIFYPNNFPKNQYSKSFGPFIFINNQYKKKNDLIEYELVHTKQFYRTFGFCYLLRLMSDKKIIEYETEAYKTCLDLKIDKNNSNLRKYVANLYAEKIINKYKLNINKKILTKTILGNN